MKKHLLSLAVMMAGATLFTACNSHDEDNSLVPVAVTNGFYVVCSGNTSSAIDGSLTYFDYNTGAATQNAFKVANGRSLGMTVNDAIRYGDKLYIVVDGEHKVFVCNIKTMKQIGVIDTTDGTMLGEEGGAHPRRLTADGGNIYVSTYGGYVAAIDTLNFTLKKKYEVGSYPEGIAIYDGYLYVCNSDYGMGQKPSISKINLATGVDTPIKNENIRNPQEIAVAGTRAYYLDYGQYGPAPAYAQENAGVYCINSAGEISCVVPNATAMATSGYNIYTVNAPYGSGQVSYNIYNIQSGSLTTMTPPEIESPACIGVDPVNNYIFIASYHLTTSEWGTYADYSSNGYVVVFDSTGTNKLDKFDCGVGPQRFAFSIGVKYVPYTF
jgi:hypothetical protein